MVGGAIDSSTVLWIILSLGTVLVLFGILIYTDHLIEVEVKTIEKSDMNQYMGYASITVGLVLVYLAMNMR
jgi:uncharacterized protein YjeT (DUF2065 family)